MPPTVPVAELASTTHLDDRPGHVADSALAAPTVVKTAPPRSPRTLWHRPRLLLAAQVVAVLSVGVTAATAVGAATTTALVVVLLGVLTRFHGGEAAIRPGLPPPGRMASDMAVPLAAVGVIGAFSATGGVTTELRAAAAVVAAMTVADALVTVLRSCLQRPVRVVVVGDHAAIARAIGCWGDDRAVKVVGGLLLDAGDDTPPVRTLMGVRAIRGIDEVVDWVDVWVADLVVVVPGPGVGPDAVRELGWRLERTGVALAVGGVLDFAGPHRIDAGVLGGRTLVHVRPSRPSGVVRSVKWCLDRVLGLGLLVLSAPVLAALWLWVRLDSPGPGFFVQTRVGRDGRSFTLYKLRTMRTYAEELKPALAGLDEGNGVLFKMRSDPRITGAGRFLRKTSLDELPQLLNVARGQMSLVGPRPALPAEVGTYDHVARRRLAVLPGMTGLWQVSGRSELSWEQSIDLDTHYTDNYSLAGDLLIGLRTVDAVVRPRGAY